MIAESFKGKIIARCFRSRLDHIMSDVYNSKQCGLNDACSLHEIFALHGEKFILHGIDHIAAMLIGPWCSAFFDDFPTWRQRLSWQRHTLTLSLAKREKKFLHTVESRSKRMRGLGELISPESFRCSELNAG